MGKTKIPCPPNCQHYSKVVELEVERDFFKKQAEKNLERIKELEAGMKIVVKHIIENQEDEYNIWD